MGIRRRHDEMTAAAHYLPSAQPPHYDTGLRSRSASLVIAAAVFFASYTTWRISADYLFTISDALFCIAVLFLVGQRRLSPRPLADLTPIWLMALAAMLIGLFLGSMINGDPIRWLIVASQYVFAFALLPMLMMGRGPAENARMALALVAGVVAMELFGALVYTFGGLTYEATQRISPEFITGGHRLGAFMADANWNAATVAMTLPFVLYLARIGRLGTLPALACASVLAIGLLLSGSFTGFASATVAIVIFLAVGGSAKIFRLALALTALASVATFSGYTTPDVFRARVGGALEQGDLTQAGTFTGRMELVREAWDIVGRTSVVGLGADQYRVVSRDRAPVHNMYLLLWAEGGLIALLGWIVMMMVPIIAATRILRTDRTAAALVLAVIAPFLIFSIAAPHMYSRSWVVPLLAALAFALPAARRSDRRHSL